MNNPAATAPAARPLRVWDRPVRLLHWLLVTLVASTWFTGDLRGPWHEWLGYGVATVVVLRLAWGFAGGRYARFAQFVRAPHATLAYAGAVLRRQAPRYLGHNPLGGWMVVALLATLASLCLSGWLSTTDWLWGYAWLANTHVALGWLLVAEVAAHLAGIAFTSWQHRENLVRAMVTGRKPRLGPGDVG